MRVIPIVDARPDFMKAAPIVAATRRVPRCRVGKARRADRQSSPCSRAGASPAPLQLEMGANRLVDPLGNQIIAATKAALTGVGKKGSVPPLWDGRAAEREDRALSGRGVDDSVRSKAQLLATISPMRHVLS